MILILKIILLISLPVLTYSQIELGKQDTLYSSIDNEPANRLKFEYMTVNKYIIVNENYYAYNSKTYYKNGILKNESSVKHDYSGKTSGEYGIRKSYYPNGSIESQTEYSSGKQNGNYSNYFQNGRLKSKGKVEKDTFTKNYVYEVFDSLGNSILSNGNGFFSEFHLDLKAVTFMEVKNSLIVRSYYFDSLINDTIYLQIDNIISPKNGWENYFLAVRNMNIDWEAVKENGSYISNISLILLEDGTIRHCINSSKLPLKLFKRIEKEFKKSLFFLPPTLGNGKNIKVRMIIPIRVL